MGLTRKPVKQRADRDRKDNTIALEELGIDQLFVDEDGMLPKDLPEFDAATATLDEL
jgi:hypothetical protein